jgi:hypothetical protein
MTALVPIILFVTTDIYKKVKIRQLKNVFERRENRHDTDLW